jgi:hypothetical protein
MVPQKSRIGPAIWSRKLTWRMCGGDPYVSRRGPALRKSRSAVPRQHRSPAERKAPRVVPLHKQGDGFQPEAVPRETRAGRTCTSLNNRPARPPTCPPAGGIIRYGALLSRCNHYAISRTSILSPLKAPLARPLWPSSTPRQGRPRPPGPAIQRAPGWVACGAPTPRARSIFDDFNRRM